MTHGQEREDPYPDGVAPEWRYFQGPPAQEQGFTVRKKLEGDQGEPVLTQAQWIALFAMRQAEIRQARWRLFWFLVLATALVAFITSPLWF